MAIARLMRCSWEARASCSVLGSGLSLKSYEGVSYVLLISRLFFVAGILAVIPYLKPLNTC